MSLAVRASGPSGVGEFGAVVEAEHEVGLCGSEPGELFGHLAGGPSPDTWRRWGYRWDATPGLHTLRVRATDGRGDVQPEARADTFPDGATGWHTISVTVTG